MSVVGPQIRAVFDCMVFLQAAARRESPAAARLLLVESGAIELYVSDDIALEIRDVLGRPRVRQKFPALTDDLVANFLLPLRKHALNIPQVPLAFTYERDLKDEPYINLAIAGRARYLVSRDSDILDLAKFGDRDGERLRRITPHLEIVDPISFLADLRREKRVLRE